MYSKLPNLVLAFHGCDLSTQKSVLDNNEFLQFSRNDYDWLGNGIYFWESNRQALNSDLANKHILFKSSQRPTPVFDNGIWAFVFGITQGMQYGVLLPNLNLCGITEKKSGGIKMSEEKYTPLGKIIYCRR